MRENRAFPALRICQKDLDVVQAQLRGSSDGVIAPNM
jgi:hypothetical protein